jgi:DNA primase small subunit
MDSFNPYSDACFIDETLIEVIADCPIKFSLKNKQFGPYNHEKIMVPRYAAVYMICKGLATID